MKTKPEDTGKWTKHERMLAPRDTIHIYVCMCSFSSNHVFYLIFLVWNKHTLPKQLGQVSKPKESENWKPDFQTIFSGFCNFVVLFIENITFVYTTSKSCYDKALKALQNFLALFIPCKSKKIH